MDTATLRVAFGLVAACVLVLFYGVTYRSTRSAYSGWWCVSLACFLSSALLFALNGSALQVVANPLGNAVGVLGAGCVWAGARSLRGRAVPRRVLAVGPSLVLVVSLLDDPAGDVWSGGVAYLAAMALLIGASAWEMRRLVHTPASGEVLRAQLHFAVASLTFASGAVSIFYAARTIAFVGLGPRHPFFQIVLGGQTTTLLTLLLLVVVTFGMSAISHEQQSSDLRVRATRDDLTGVLNRAEFLRVAGQQVRGRGAVRAAVLVADLDRFKMLNDGFGHAAGDRALASFADVCVTVIGTSGLVGRLGGDEFVLLVPDEGADALAESIGRRYRIAGDRAPAPTVSFGIATVTGRDITLAIARADEALYRAKAAGRARLARHGVDGPDRPAGRRTA